MQANLTDEEVIRHYLPTQPDHCFEALYNRYVKKVYRRCLSMTNDSSQAEDFTHDIFIKVFHKLDGFQQKSSFSTWLYSVSYNYCADQLRLSKRLSTTTLKENTDWYNSDSTEAQLREETLQVMKMAMEKLSNQERSLLRLKYEDGLSIEEIAQMYELKASAVKMRLKRSREKIQRLCANHN